MHQARGTFDVKVSPLAEDAVGKATGVGRLQLDKRFHGSLQASSVGQMLASGNGRTFGAYVAIEKVKGNLDGRTGTFDLVHHARMNGGVPEAWTVSVVPGSGTGELEGISGAMVIEITDGVHHYEFSYAIEGRGGAAAP